jgi:glycosyltransferase involved in cell wall biosynthesis
MQPDVVHSHGYRPDVLDAGVARALEIPTVTTVHGFTGGDGKNRLYERLQRLAFRRFDAVVAVSRPLVQELTRWGVSESKLRLLPNAYVHDTPLLDRHAARKALGIPPNRFVVGWVGRLNTEKGGDILVDAFAKLPNREVHLSIIGDGPDRSLLQVRARSLGVSDLITWHGKVKDAGRLFPAFDIFVLSSRTEGTPMALFEAMAAGVPIVASRVGGVPDVISTAEGLLVPPEDTAALASAITECQANGSAATQRAQAASAKLARDFRVEPWLVRYEQLYRELRFPR